MMKRMIMLIVVVVGMMGNKSFGEGEGEGYLLYFSVALTVPNLIFNGINIYQIYQTKTNDHVIATIGIVTGGLQMLSALPYITDPYLSQFDIVRNIGYGSFAFGAITVGTSIWNLSTDHKPQDTRSSWNLYSFPTHDKSLGMGISYSLRF